MQQQEAKYEHKKQVFGDRPSRIIPKRERRTAELLAQKKYLTDSVKIYDDQLRLIETFLCQYPAPLSYPDNLNDDCPDYRILLAPSFQKSDNTEKWLSAKYESNPDHPEDLIIPTKSGIKVRSKSEAIIADALFERSIPFRYEQLLWLGDLKYYPDFTILDPRDRARTIIWEHLGRMDDRGYVNRIRFKLGNYLEAQYIPGINLILTCETRRVPLDVNYVLLMISYFFE